MGAAAMNRDLISYLKKQRHYVPVADVEEQLELSRDALFSQVEELIEAGYTVEFHPYLGLKLIDIPDRFLKHEIRDDLNTRHIGRKLKIYDEVAGTNSTAWELLEADPELPDGTVVIAESQTQGRGRMGREWHSARGQGLWMSVVLRVNMPPDKLAYLTAMAALAVANTLQQFVQLPAEIKWPNDVFIRGRKCCGILVEARSNMPGVFVMGIGLNVNQQRTDFPESLRDIATSLRLERPRSQALNRVRILRPLLFYLERVYELVRKRKWDRLAKAWSEFVHMGGKHISLQHAGETFTGTVKRVHPAEGITLRLDSDNEPPADEQDSDTAIERTFPAESVSNVLEVKDDPPSEADNA
jgi:BirA family transcriptional regulator, biotin operon repressor / biotin---[acetyl-CoA-carboxylase] ligase